MVGQMLAQARTAIALLGVSLALSAVLGEAQTLTAPLEPPHGPRACISAAETHMAHEDPSGPADAERPDYTLTAC